MSRGFLVGPELAAALPGVVRRVLGAPTRSRQRPARIVTVTRRAREWELCKVVDRSPMPMKFYRWEYTLLREDGETEVDAINVMENGNTADRVGPGIEIETLPDGFDVQPIGWTHAGEAVECYVFARPGPTDEDPWEFQAENAVDGECPEA